MNEKVYCKVCQKTTEWEDTEDILPGWSPRTTAYRCTECDTESIIVKWPKILQYLTKERKSIPQPCPKCRSVNAKFHYTEPDYGDAWKCLDCENTYPGWGESIPTPFFFGNWQTTASCEGCKNYEPITLSTKPREEVE